MHIGIIIGGVSSEHEVSIASAKNVLKNMKMEYELSIIYIDQRNIVHELTYEEAMNIKCEQDDAKIVLNKMTNESMTRLIKFISSSDVILPIIHGDSGEDGAIQGVAKFFGVPIIGNNILTSSLTYDKSISKIIMKSYGISVVDFLEFNISNINIGYKSIMEKVKKNFQFPIILKPSDKGSSIGINVIRNDSEFKKSLYDVVNYSSRILIEPFLTVRELECAFVGDSSGKYVLSRLGEIVKRNNFYDYDEKYINNSITLDFTPQISDSIEEKAMEYAKRLVEIFELRGMARIDFFLANGDLYVNEINSIPGFTDNSFYFKLLDKMGLSEKEVLKIMIDSVKSEGKNESNNRV